MNDNDKTIAMDAQRIAAVLAAVAQEYEADTASMTYKKDNYKLTITYEENLDI